MGADSSDADDPYYIGDCYERAEIAQEWELNGSQYPYLTYVKSLANTWKPLRHLADWMEVGTDPVRWNKIKSIAKHREERANCTHVTIIDYPSVGEPKQVTLRDTSALKEALLRVDHGEGGGTTLRLFLVEDLSRQVIELLGPRYEVDPLFFREQIVDSIWYNTRDSWASAPPLLAEMRHRNWFRLRNVRLRYFTSDSSFKTACGEAKDFNVLRKLDNDENNWRYKDLPEAIFTLSRTRTSIWVGKDGNNGGMVGIVLIDPTVREGTPLWYGHTNWLRPPSMKLSERVPKPTPDSLYETIIQATSTYPWFPDDNGPATDQQIFVKPTIYTICAEWLVVCDYVKTRLSQIEWELEKPSVFRSKGDVIDSSLKRLHTWRRVIPTFREMVNETIEQAIPAAARLTSPFYTPFTPLSPIRSADQPYADIIPDLERIKKTLSELQSRVDRLTEVVTSEMTIEDSRRGLQENHNLARLTWMATIFIPLTFVSGLFSMQNDISEMRITFGWYFLAAVPLTVFTLVIASGVGRGWWRKKDKTDRKVKLSEKTT